VLAQAGRQPADDTGVARFKGPDGGRDVLEHVAAGVQEVQQDRDPGGSAADAGLKAFRDGRLFDVQEGGLEDRHARTGREPGRERVDLLARLFGPGTVADEEDGVQIFLTSETRPPRLLGETSASST
jgi:hypothetical protein